MREERVVRYYRKNVGAPCISKNRKGKELSIYSRNDDDRTIASLVFPYNNKQTGNTNAFEKSRKSLQTQYAIDKIRIIVYFWVIRQR